MKNVIYFKAYNRGQDIKLIHIDALKSSSVIWVPGNNSLEHLGTLDSTKNFFINFGEENIKIPRPNLIVNCVADCDIFYDKLKILNDNFAKIENCQIINHPKYILETSRDEIAKKLINIDNLIIPKTIRIVADNKKDFIKKLQKEFPKKSTILIRKIGFHRGESLIKVDIAKNLEQQLDIIAFDNQICYATEFHNFQSSDSLYRKTRIIMINGEPYIRHQIISDNWNIHSDSRQYMLKNDNLKQEEEKFVASSLEHLRPILNQIYDKVKLDIFGIDCALLNDNKILIFEINASMEFVNQNTTNFKYLENQINKIKAAFIAMLQQKIC